MSKLLNEEQIVAMAKWKLLGETSCARCKFLYFHDSGYSNYTVENTSTLCALDKNPHLRSDPPQDMPYDWDYNDRPDNWPATKNSRCEHYDPLGEGRGHVHLDVDGEDFPGDQAQDIEAAQAIERHSGRTRG